MSSYQSILQFWKDHQSGKNNQTSFRPNENIQQNQYNQYNQHNQQNSNEQTYVQYQDQIPMNQRYSQISPNEFCMSKKMILLRLKLYLVENRQINISSWNPSNEEIHKMFHRDLDRIYEYPIFRDCIQQIKIEHNCGSSLQNITYLEYIQLLDEINRLKIFEKFILQNTITELPYRFFICVN